jgi:hypothetical protein
MRASAACAGLLTILTTRSNYQGSSVVIGPAGATIGINAPFSLKAEAGFHLAPRTLSSGKTSTRSLVAA